MLLQRFGVKKYLFLKLLFFILMILMDENDISWTNVKEILCFSF